MFDLYGSDCRSHFAQSLRTLLLQVRKTKDRERFFKNNTFQKHILFENKFRKICYRACIGGVVRYGDPQCPECRRPFDPDIDITNARFMRLMMSDIQLKCPEDGCHKILSHDYEQCSKKYGISRIRIRFPNNSAYPYAYPYTTDTQGIRYFFGQKQFFSEIKYG